MTSNHLPLEGVSVLDLTTMLSGSLVTGLLASERHVSESAHARSY